MIGFDLVGYLIFAFVTSITPGPNNYMLLFYGKRYGFRDSGKLMAGIFLGFSALLYITGYGVAEIVTSNPTIGLVFKIISSIWLFYLAFALSKLNEPNSVVADTKFGFFQGFFMQFVNPKAWIMAVSGASAFLPHLSNIHLSVFVFAFSFGFVGIPCMVAWVSFGDAISKLIKSQLMHNIIGGVLFALMLMSIVMIWL